MLGILLLNAYGQLVPRRRLIEGGLMALGIALAFLSVAAARCRASCVRGSTAMGPSRWSRSSPLLGIIVAIALTAGVAYAFVAIPAQTQLQEELPEDVRGRVFGVLNMLVSVASFVPIIIAGPLADTLGTSLVLFLMAALVVGTGVRAVFLRWPTPLSHEPAAAHVAPIDPLTVTAMALGHVGDAPSEAGRAERGDRAP